MNGRLYDPILHRFLSPDNFVQDPFNTQNFNRYAYVLNNPLMYTDPSGEFIFETSAAIYYGIGAAIMIGSAINKFWGENIAKAQIGSWLGTNLKSAGNDISRPFRETGRFFRRLFGGGDSSAKQTIFNPSSQILVDPALGNSGNSSLQISTGVGGSNSSLSNQNWLSPFQTGLDVVGLVPVVGEIADGINAAIYLYQGDYVNAGLSGTAMIPFLGMGATGAKLGIKAKNAFNLTSAAKGEGRVFWSGEGALNAATNYAKSAGGITLEMTRAGQNLQNLITTRNIPWAEARPMWQRLSTVYAKGANGTVHFFPGTTVSPGSIWLNTEKNILLLNGVKIITH